MRPPHVALVGLALLAGACSAAATPPPDISDVPSTPPSATPRSDAASIWTAPPTPTRTVTPEPTVPAMRTATPDPTVAVTLVPTFVPRTPAPTAIAPSPRVASHVPSATPTRSPAIPPASATARPTASAATGTDPWTRYSSGAGATIYLPSTWRPLAPGVYANTTLTFAASPEDPSIPLANHLVLVTLMAMRRDTPLASVDAFADAVQATPALNGADVIRRAGTHPSGSVIFLDYLTRTTSGQREQEIDALFVVNGTGWILGMRAPDDERWDQYASFFQKIFDRFRLG